MKSVGAAPRRNDHVRAAIAALFRGGAQRDGAELLDIVGIQPLDIALWIGHRGLIGVNAVNRDVMSAVAGSKHVRARARAVRRPLHHAWLQRQQGERIASVERQVLHLFCIHDIAHGGIRGFQALIVRFHYLYGLADRPHFQADVHNQRRTYCQNVVHTPEGLEPSKRHSDAVAPGSQRCKGIIA